MASMKFQPHMLVQCVPSIRSRQNAKNMLFVAICKSHLRAPNKIISIHPSIYLSTYPILSYPTLPYPILSHPILSYPIYLYIWQWHIHIHIYIYTYTYTYIYIYLLIYVFIFLLGKRQLPLLTVVPVCASALHGRRTQKVLREQRSL